MGYDRGDSFPFDFEPNGVPFGSKSKAKLSPRLYPIQFERKSNTSFLSVLGKHLMVARSSKGRSALFCRASLRRTFRRTACRGARSSLATTPVGKERKVENRHYKNSEIWSEWTRVFIDSQSLSAGGLRNDFSIRGQPHQGYAGIIFNYIKAQTICLYIIEVNIIVVILFDRVKNMEDEFLRSDRGYRIS